MSRQALPVRRASTPARPPQGPSRVGVLLLAGCGEPNARQNPKGVVLLRWKLAETAWAKMSDVDDEQKLRDASGDLLAKVATGELSRKDAERELHIMRAFCELISMVTEKWQDWPCPPEEGVRREATMIAMWPKACRRADVSVIDMPHNVLHAITRSSGGPLS